VRFMHPAVFEPDEIPLCGLLRTKYFYAILNCFSLRENVTGFQLFLKWLGNADGFPFSNKIDNN